MTTVQLSFPTYLYYWHQWSRKNRLTHMMMHSMVVSSLRTHPMNFIVMTTSLIMS